MFSFLKKVARLFAGYSAGIGLELQLFQQFDPNRSSSVDPVLAVQLVPDRFYFLLFGAIRVRLQAHCPNSARLLAVRAVSGAIGTGWTAELKRSAIAARLSGRPWIRAYGALFDGVAYRSSSYRHPLQDCKDWISSNALWRQIQGKEDQFSLRIDGMEVADLLVDSYLRFRPSPRFDAADPFVRRLIWQALRDVRQANAYFGRAKPRWYISSYSTYLEHGVAVRAAIRHQVPVWTFGSFTQFGKRLNTGDSFHTADFSEYRSRFETLEDKDGCLLAARKVLDQRLNGGIDMATSYMRQSAYGKTEAAVPQGLDGAVIVFLHDFYDSPHVYPNLVFQDFWRWICFTIEVLQKACIRFFLKPHPNQIALSDAVLPALSQKYSGIEWIPPGVNNVQLVQAGMSCGVTAYGTVAHELAYLGVPSIACARHPHHAFDFCRTARSRDEYADMLRSFNAQPLPKVAMQQQALAFFYMHNLYGTPGQLELRHAFVDLWKLCDSKTTEESDIQRAIETLYRLPEFDQFVRSMARA
jgi:hypothetical protein